ncbi:MAG: choice-of-anchor D domain-containing protein [Bryobacteraceae bacterium]
MKRLFQIPSIAALALMALPAIGQAQAPFSVRVALADSTSDIADGTPVTLAAGGIGQSASAGFSFSSTTSSIVQVNFIQLSGSSDFTLASVPAAPFSVERNGSFGIQVQFKASTSARTSGRLQINYTVDNRTGTLSFPLAGIAPEFIFSAIPQGANQILLNDGATIPFPDTAIDATSTAVIVAQNRGTYQGVFNSATVAGAGFATSGVPLSGTVVEAGREVRFSVTYTPKTFDPGAGTLALATADKRATFNLSGNAAGSRFTYEYFTDGAGMPVPPNGSIAVPDAQVGGDKTSVLVRFRNAGNADTRITTISVAGPGYSLSDAPLLPLLVPIGQTFSLTVNFLPTTPGRSIGRLRIGSDDFDLVSNALGSKLEFNFSANSISTPVASGGTVIFTPAAVGANSGVQFTMTNTGNSPTTVSSIGLAAPSTVFTLEGVPALPIQLEPNATAGFRVVFAPVALGTATATLRVDNLNFTLSGAGNAPPPLPAIRFDGASGAQAALAQPAIGLTIASAYPLALSGKLNLAFSSDVFANDPSVQFAAGGRSVDFTIPANSTRAVFPNNQTQIRVQTGSVAGTIVVTPDIATTAGGINLTPATPPQATLSVASGAPVVLQVSVASRTTNVLTLLVNGYATNRSVQRIDLRFTPTSGENVQTTQLSLPAEAAFLGYFQGQASQPFGSLFSATVPLTLQGDVTNVSSVLDTIQSVAVTLTNAVGTSPAVTLNLR